MAGSQGLSEDSSMGNNKREEIHRLGGKASGTGNTSSKNSRIITNKSGGGHLTKEDQRKGGHMSGGTSS